MTFVARRISRPPGVDAWPVQLIYRASEVAQLHELAAYVEAARLTADAVVERAHCTAAEHEARILRDEARHRRDSDAAFLRRAVALEAAYRSCREALLARLEPVLDAALEAALQRIAVRMPADQRVAIVVDELRKQIDPGPAAQLHLSAGDEAATRAMGLAFPWPIEVDEALAAGACRLSSGEGEWLLSFDALIESISNAAR
ncbi:HrpE/YscL family type III secretion apparatus protein [Trinickia symbiotica]|nr:HrpE/YscL family type III secretion apparatus protein [Trinickia symbiotica]